MAKVLGGLAVKIGERKQRHVTRGEKMTLFIGVTAMFTFVILALIIQEVL